MSALRYVPLCLAFLLSLPAQSQTLLYGPNVTPGLGFNYLAGTPVNLANTFLSTWALYGPGTITGDGTPGSVQQRDPEFVRLSSLVDYIQAPNSAALAMISARIDRLNNRFREGIALAGAINVLPPNPGDRFAVSFGGAGYDGSGAGSVAVSARIDENTLVYVGYARGPTQNFVKGGVGFSLR